MNICPDLQLIDNVKQLNDSNSLIELSKRHLPLCESIYNKYYSSVQSSGVFIDDLKNDNYLLVYNSAKSYDPSKNVKFSTWLGNNVRFQCLNAIKSHKHITLDTQDVIFASDKIQVSEEEPTSEDKEYIFNILDQLVDARIKSVFYLRYFENHPKKLSWRKVGLKLNISPQTALNLYKKGKRMLVSKMKSKNISDKI